MHILDVESKYLATPENITFENESCLKDFIDFQIKQTTFITESELAFLNVLDTNSIVLLKESINDVLSSIGEWISKAIKYLFNMVKSFFEKMEYFIDDEAFIKHNIDVLKNYGSNTFSLQGFKYTIKDLNLSVLFNDAITEIHKLINLCNSGDKEKIHNELDNDYNQSILRNTDEYFGYIRSKILGRSGFISREEFRSKCSKSFRNNSGEPELIVVNKSMIESIISNQNNINFYKYKSEVNKQSTDVNNKLSELDRLLDQLIRSTNKIKGIGSEDVYKRVIAHAYKISMISNNIYRECMIYFTLKLEAIKEMVSQNKHILRQAIINHHKLQKGV